MSQFVNFNKRAFTLPPGCKDLIDLLAPPRKRVRPKGGSQSLPPPKVQNERFPSAGLGQLDRFVGMLLNSPAEGFVISISAKGLRFPVSLYRSNAERVTAILLVTSDVPESEAVRDFFAVRQLRPWVNRAQEDTGSLVYRLPTEVPALTALLTQLLQGVYALGEDAGLEFTYREIENTP